MPFFCAPFADLSLVALSQWDDRQTNCKLRVLTTRESAVKLIEELPEKEAQQLSQHLVVLKQGLAEKPLEIHGDTALSLSSYVANFHNKVAEYRYIPAGPELFGFWDPPENRPPGEGIIMWFDGDDGYHVVIARSKVQAERVIRDLDWLDEGWLERFLKRIQRWNVARRPSRGPQRIEGPAAEMFCRASFFQKVCNASRAHTN